MWKNELIKAAEGACSPLLPRLSPLRASARAELRDPRFQVLLLPLCLDWTAQPPQRTTQGPGPASRPFPRRTLWGAGTPISQPSWVCRPTLFVSQYCAVSCFNKGDLWTEPGWCSLEREGQCQVSLRVCGSRQPPHPCYQPLAQANSTENVYYYTIAR